MNGGKKLDDKVKLEYGIGSIVWGRVVSVKKEDNYIKRGVVITKWQGDVPIYMRQKHGYFILKNKVEKCSITTE